MGCGAKIDRANMRRALDQLDAGDVLMVTRLDRLAGKYGAPCLHSHKERPSRASHHGIDAVARARFVNQLAPASHAIPAAAARAQELIEFLSDMRNRTTRRRCRRI